MLAKYPVSLSTLSVRGVGVSFISDTIITLRCLVNKKDKKNVDDVNRDA